MSLKTLLLVSIFLLLATISSYSQSENTGKVEIFADSRVNSLIEKHKAVCSKEKIIGWRVQIFFDSGNNSKSKAYSKKGAFSAKHPDIGSYLSFQSPNYKVRVGDFRTRMDAEGFKKGLLSDSPDSFVVRDEIRFPLFW